MTISQPVDRALAEAHNIQGIFFVVTPNPAELRRIADLAEHGDLRPIIARTFPLAEAAVAYGPPPDLEPTRKDDPGGPIMITAGGCTARAGPEHLSSARLALLRARARE